MIMKRLLTAICLLLLPLTSCSSPNNNNTAGQATNSKGNTSYTEEASSQQPTTTVGIFPTSSKGGEDIVKPADTDFLPSDSSATSGTTTASNSPVFSGNLPTSSNSALAKTTAPSSTVTSLPESRTETSQPTIQIGHGTSSVMSSSTGETHRQETTATPTTTTTAKEKSPWRYPYDIPAIIQECKAEISRVGLVWDDALGGLPGNAGTPIGLPPGVSESDPSIIWAAWNNPDSTVLYTKYPEGYTYGNFVFNGSLKSYIFDDLIPFYVDRQEQYSIACCRIYFEPNADHAGDYTIYFLYGT